MNASTARGVRCPSGELLVRTWPASSPSWGALLVHGYAEHSGRYQGVAEALAESGAHVVAFDLPGHGRSPGTPATLDDIDRILSDVDTIRCVLAEQLPDLPLVLIGHSMGGMIATRYAQTRPESFDALVLSSPVLGTWHYLDLLECSDIPTTPIDPGALSRDPRVGEDYASDPLVFHGAFPRATLLTVDGCLDAINHGPALAMPTLWLHGEDDEIVPEADTRTGIDRIRGQSFHELIYPGGRHEMFHETNAGQVLDDLRRFLGRVLGPPAFGT